MSFDATLMKNTIAEEMERILLICDEGRKAQHLSAVGHWKPAKRALHSMNKYCH